MKGNILYRIYGRSGMLYVGRTKQDLQQRIRGHFFAKPMHRKIDAFAVTRIEYAEFQTEADMYLYEVYFINRDKPLLNVDDRAHDSLTLDLPPVEWTMYQPPMMEKWLGQLKDSPAHARVMKWLAQREAVRAGQEAPIVPL